MSNPLRAATQVIIESLLGDSITMLCVTNLPSFSPGSALSCHPNKLIGGALVIEIQIGLGASQGVPSRNYGTRSGRRIARIPHYQSTEELHPREKMPLHPLAGLTEAVPGSAGWERRKTALLSPPALEAR